MLGLLGGGRELDGGDLGGAGGGMEATVTATCGSMSSAGRDKRGSLAPSPPGDPIPKFLGGSNRRNRTGPISELGVVGAVLGPW
jgi:hypothetical protein